MSEIDRDYIQQSTSNDEKHEYVTLEHIMYSLLEDESVIEILEKIDCDYLSAKEDLKNYLKDTEFNGLKGEVVFEGKPKKTTAIERVLQRAFAQVILSARDPSCSY